MKKDGRASRRMMWHWLQTFFGIGRGADAGARGEAQAAAWLRRERGFTIVARNWRSPRDRREELDLVCRDGEALVFVEVKTRAPEALVPGFFAVNRRKKRVLRRAIDAYLAQLPRTPRTVRLDVVEVVFKAGTGEAEVLHFENVRLFSKYFRG